MLRALRLWAHTRTAFLVVFAAIGLIVAGTVVVIACCDPPIVVDGMLGADHGPGGKHIRAMTVPGPQKHAYTIDPNIKPFVVKRDGVPWFTIWPTYGGVVEISDPNGTPGVVVIKASARGR
jgi:hypothetical protein